MVYIPGFVKLWWYSKDMAAVWQITSTSDDSSAQVQWQEVGAVYVFKA